ncbi:MAG: DUF1292 domain-containing protein [Clostridia bacterium]|nr:DUF1292 domain-containing protein [Clostridia bacterium]
MEQEKNPIECLLDVENSEPIVLYDENDKPIKFEQVALIPHKDELYAMLKPIDKLDGVADDEAVIFHFEEDENGAQVLSVLGDDQLIDEIFAIYLDLVKEEEQAIADNSKKSKK